MSRETCGAAKGMVSGTTSESQLEHLYHYSICKRGSMRLQSDGEIRVPEMIPSHVDDRDFIIFRHSVPQNIKYK